MKKLTIILAILICSLNLFSQVAETKEQQEAQLAKYRSFCIEKSKREVKQGVILQGAGLLIYGATRFDEINGKKMADKWWSRESQVIWRVKEAGGRTDLLYYSISGKYDNKLRNAEKLKKAGFISGCAVAIVGLGFQVHSMTWIRRAYIGENGIGVTIPLSK